MQVTKVCRLYMSMSGGREAFISCKRAEHKRVYAESSFRRAPKTENCSRTYVADRRKELCF